MTRLVTGFLRHLGTGNVFYIQKAGDGVLNAALCTLPYTPLLFLDGLLPSRARFRFGWRHKNRHNIRGFQTVPK